MRTKLLAGIGTLLICASAMPGQTAPTITTTTTSVELVFQQPSTAVTPAAVRIMATSGTVAFAVDMSTVPLWLKVSPTTSGADTGGSDLTFDQTAMVPSLSAGSYSASVKLKVSGATALTIPVKLTVKSAPAIITVPDAANVVFNWDRSLGYPTKTLTLKSNGDPVSVDITSSATATANGNVANWISVTPSAVAYNWGTSVRVNFDAAAFDTAKVGDTLSGTIAFTPVNGTAQRTVNVTITVTRPPATIAGIYPSELPVKANPAAANRTIAVYGANFINDAGLETTVRIGTANPPVTPVTHDCAAFTALNDNTANALCIVNSSTMLIKLTEGTGRNLGAAGTFYVSVQNGATALAQQAITITTKPIVYALTNSASFAQPDFGSNPVVAPYELVTIFGENLSSSAPAVAPSGTPARYPNVVTDGSSRQIKVSFQRASDDLPLARDPDGYLLYVSPTQINLMVPSDIATLIGTGTAEMVVTYDAGGTPVTSTALTLNVAAAHPGIYTIDDSGTGAILNQDNTVNSGTNMAKAGQTIQIYLTGMGAPNSTGANTVTTTALAWPASCVSVANYLAKFSGWNTLDGAVTDTTTTYLTANHYLPCFSNRAVGTSYTPTSVTITNGSTIKTANVTYAGWVAGAVTGLYQVNATVPSGLPAGAYPIVVTINGKSTQSGVYVHVTP